MVPSTARRNEGLHCPHENNHSDLTSMRRQHLQGLMNEVETIPIKQEKFLCWARQGANRTSTPCEACKRQFQTRCHVATCLECPLWIHGRPALTPEKSPNEQQPPKVNPEDETLVKPKQLLYQSLSTYSCCWSFAPHPQSNSSGDGVIKASPTQSLQFPDFTLLKKLCDSKRQLLVG